MKTPYKNKNNKGWLKILKGEEQISYEKQCNNDAGKTCLGSEAESTVTDL